LSLASRESITSNGRILLVLMSIKEYVEYWELYPGELLRPSPHTTSGSSTLSSSSCLYVCQYSCTPSMAYFSWILQKIFFLN
jgi:hypothetical protein